MSDVLEMNLPERMAILSFASKSAEMLSQKTPPWHDVDIAQWKALATQAEKILARLDAEWPAMIPLPHDGVAWKDRP